MVFQSTTKGNIRNIIVKLLGCLSESQVLLLYFSVFMLHARKTNMFTLFGFSEDLNGETMLPALLNTRSEGALVAHIVIYFLPTFERRGNLA